MARKRVGLRTSVYQSRKDTSILAIKTIHCDRMSASLEAGALGSDFMQGGKRNAIPIG
jgi:hypothetical protein